MNKDQIRAELDARGITYNARLGADKLQVILDEAIAAETPAPAAPTEPETPAPAEPAAPAPTEPEAPAPAAPVEDEREVDDTKITVLDKHGRVARTYTLETHGENFIELAQEYASHRGFRIGTVYKR